MKTIASTKMASTDDTYYVSAADVADKIIDRMRRGLDPLLLTNWRAGSFARIAYAPSASMPPWWQSESVRKPRDKR
jgi:hypothetical protein